jgi:hypothetical protein
MGIHHSDTHPLDFSNSRMAKGTHPSQEHGGNAQAEARQGGFPRIDHAGQRSLLFAGRDDAQNKRGYRVALERSESLGVAFSQRNLCDRLRLGREIRCQGPVDAYEAGNVSQHWNGIWFCRKSLTARTWGGVGNGLPQQSL